MRLIWAWSQTDPEDGQPLHHHGFGGRRGVRSVYMRTPSKPLKFPEEDPSDTTTQHWDITMYNVSCHLYVPVRLRILTAGLTFVGRCGQDGNKVLVPDLPISKTRQEASHHWGNSSRGKVSELEIIFWCLSLRFSTALLLLLKVFRMSIISTFTRVTCRKPWEERMTSLQNIWTTRVPIVSLPLLQLNGRNIASPSGWLWL